MMTTDDVTDAMVSAWSRSMRNQNCTIGFHDELREAIAAAINASGCVLVPREPVALQELEDALSAIPCDCPERRIERGDHLTCCFMFDAYAAYDRLKAMLAAAPQPGKEKGDGTGQ